VLPIGLAVVPGSPAGPADWTFTITPVGLDGAGVCRSHPGESVVITYQAEVGCFPGRRRAVLGDLENHVCVDSVETDMNPANNCNVDVSDQVDLPVGRRALPQRHPWVQFSIVPTNILSVRRRPRSR
jgi:hypothetical protein